MGIGDAMHLVTMNVKRAALITAGMCMHLVTMTTGSYVLDAELDICTSPTLTWLAGPGQSLDVIAFIEPTFKLRDRIMMGKVNQSYHIFLSTGKPHGHWRCYACAFSDNECQMSSLCHISNALYYGRCYLVILNVESRVLGAEPVTPTPMYMHSECEMGSSCHILPQQ